MKIVYKTLNSDLSSDEISSSTSIKQYDDGKRDAEDTGFGQNGLVDMMACKPCCVVLKRLSDKDVGNLLSRNNLGMKNAKSRRKGNQLPTSKKRRSTPRGRNRKNLRNTSLKEPNDDLDLKKSDKKTSNQEKPNKVESDSSSDNCAQYGRESHLRNKSTNKFRLSLQGQKLSCHSSKIKDSSRKPSDTGESSGISTLNFKSKVSLPKRFALSLTKKTTDLEDHEAWTADPCGEIVGTKDVAQLEDTSINSEDPESESLLPTGLGPLPRSKMAVIDRAEPRGPDPTSETLQSEDLNASQGDEITSDDFENKIRPSKHFRLSLKKKRITAENDESARQDPASKISPLQDFDQTSGRKRTLIRISDGQPSGSSKPKRRKEKEVETSDEHKEINELDSVSHEAEVSKRSNKRVTVHQIRVVSNRSCKQKANCEVINKVPVVRNLRVSLPKLECTGNATTFMQGKDVDPLDRTTNTCETFGDDGTKVLEKKPTDLGKDCPKISRNAKITDYFFRIVKSSVVLSGSTENLAQKNIDSILKKKHGIFKNPIVSLINCKQLKKDEPKYSASEVGKLTQEHANSSTNFKSTNIETNVPSSQSSVSSGNNLSCSFNELSTNDQQSSDGTINRFLTLDPVEESSHDLLHTPTVRTTKNLSPTNHKSKFQLVKERSPAKSTEDSLNDNLSLRSGTLVSRSRSETKSLRNTHHVENDSTIDNDSNRHKEVPDKNSSELRTESQSPVANAENHSSDSLVNNATPKLSSSLTSQIKRPPATPEKRSVLIDDEIQTKETEVPVINVITNSPETNETPVTSDAMTCTDSSEALPDGEEQRKRVSDTLVANEDLTTVTHPSDTHPTRVTKIKSPTKVGESRTPSKQENQRRFPVNSMTILTCEMLDETCLATSLTDAVDNLTETAAATAKNCTTQENEGPQCCPNKDTTQEKNRISCDATENVGNLLSNSNAVGAEKKQEDANLDTDKRHSAVSGNKNSRLRELLSTKHIEYPFGELPAFRNIESYSSELNMLTTSGTVETTIDDVQRNDLTSEKEVSVPGILIPETTSPIEDSIAPIPVVTIDQDLGKSSTEDELLTDLPQEDRLLVDTDENDSDPSIEETLTDTSFSNCSASSVAAQVEKGSKKSKVSAVYECVICRKTCKHAQELEKHLNMHVINNHNCCICDIPLTKKNATEHYFKHCRCLEGGKSGTFACSICPMKFRTKPSLGNHMKVKHSINHKRSKRKIGAVNIDQNKCSICLMICKSKEDLQAHVYAHTGRELIDAFNLAKAKQQQRSSTPTNCKNQNNSNTVEEGNTENKEQAPTESTEPSSTSTTLPPAIPNCEVSVCTCHTDERLEISGGVIIEVALACLQCKTFFKSRKCFKDHYTSSSCTWSDKTEVIPKMFCNQCYVILNSLQEMHSHLKKHGEVDLEMKTSFLCKHCNIFFFGIGSLFYTHWFSHCNNPLFVADHCSFSNNIKVKIIEPGCPELDKKDEPTESLFIAQHQCRNCAKPFQTENDLKKHLNASKSCSEKVDSTPQGSENARPCFKLICSICNKEFMDKSTFDTHMEEHDDIRDFLNRPKHTDKSLENNQFSCSICKTQYDTIMDYTEHLIRHEIIQEKFVCNYCTLMMDSIKDFELHSAQHKGTPEKPVACKVIFATAKYHCKSCKIWFDNQSILEEHLATHTTSVISSPKSVEKSTPEVGPVIEKESSGGSVCEEEFDDQVKLDTHVSMSDKGVSERTIVDPVVIHLSDDSNSTDVEIIASERNDQDIESVVGDTSRAQETKKPTFLRVKNLKELLPYACKKCKAEFDTETNLSNHVCTQNLESAQDEGFNYICTICKNYQCDNDSDWNLHVLSHFPLQRSPNFNESWFHVIKMSSGQHFFKCNFCPNYRCGIIRAMRDHFITIHPNIYRPIFECRICRTFKTEMEQEIRRHEAAHFQRLSVPPHLSCSADNSSTAQPDKNSNSSPQPNSIKPTTSSGNSSSSIQPVQNSNSFQQPVPSPPITSSGNNSSSLQSVQNFHKSQQPTARPPLISVSSKLLSLQPVDNSNNFQQPALIPSDTSASNNLPLVQPMQNLNNFQQSGSTFRLENSSNNLQQSDSTFRTDKITSNNIQQLITIPSVISTSSKLPSPTPQPNCNSNNFQQSISIPAVSHSGTNLMSVQPVNSSNKLQQTVLIPPVTSSENNSSSLQQTDNSQWLATTSQTFQIQINNTPLFNNLTGVVHTLPLYVANIYCCRFCKSFKFSSEQELKIHEAQHELIQMGDPSKKYYRCKVCTNVFCSSEDHLRVHMEVYHKAEKSANVLQNQTQADATDTQIKCKNCLKIFPSSAHLTQHMNTCNTPVNQQRNDTQFQNVYPYSCQLCSIGFLNEAFLDAHIRQIHTTANMPRPKLNDTKTLYKCDICGLLLISEATLNYHMKSHNVEFH